MRDRAGWFGGLVAFFSPKSFLPSAQLAGLVGVPDLGPSCLGT